MATVAETLREVHRLRKLIRDLQEQVAEGPALLSAEQARLSRAEADVAAARDNLKHLKVTIHDRETSLKAAHQQVAKYEKQRETAASKKELDAFDHEIGHGRQKCSALEDEILAGLAEIDERTAQIPELEKALARVRDESAGFQKEADERIRRLQGELERAQAELAEVEKAIPPEIRPQYNRLLGFHGADALARVENRTCQACYASVTLQNTRELEAGQFVTCKSCGRAMYL